MHKNIILKENSTSRSKSHLEKDVAALNFAILYTFVAFILFFLITLH